jgi:hypothetical protein
MIVGQIEGYLAGDVVIRLNRSIHQAKYKITYELKDKNGVYYKFLPSFPVFQHETFVEFRTLEFSSLYMRVTVEYIEEISTGVLPKPCSPCNSLI